MASSAGQAAARVEQGAGPARRPRLPDRPDLDDLADAQGDQLSATLAQMAGLVLSRETVDTALPLVTTLAATTTRGSIGCGTSPWVAPASSRAC